MKIAIIGSNGQLGTDLMEILKIQHQVVGFTHNDIEISDYNSTMLLKEDQPNVIINTAAFHKTDQCEEEPLKTFSVNAIGARNVALISKEIGAISVFISTDYVFDGRKKEPYTEDDIPFPANIYGISKLAGEHCTRQNSKHYIVRIASVFGSAGAQGKGGNFVEKMIKMAKNNKTITVVDDLWMSPTYTRDAALILKKILELQLPYGVYHATNKGFCSWYQFAKEIFKLTGLNPDLKPIKADSTQCRARRPHFSALQSIKLPKYNVEIREWNNALHAYLIEKGHIKK
jgi:dTDP-4-dehydrorhamnose reductase